MEGVDPMLAMASSTGVTHPSSANALAVGLRDAQQLEVMSSSSRSNDSPAAGDTKPAPINPLLLASACFGSSGALDFLFSREDAHKPPMILPTQEFLDLLIPFGSSRRRLTVPQDSGDVEDGVDQSCLPATTLLLQGVTPQGDNALHAVASHGDSREFLKCASIIYKRDQHLLFAVNRKGDTPLHCAARAGKSEMLSCLIELAESYNRLHELLRRENVFKETALHDAVRVGDKDSVELLLWADPCLANYPEEGTSPLYLAVIMERNDIARTLYDKSCGNLSYHGPHGQNALHAAVLRGAVITGYILKWNNSLTTHGDIDGSTPLHFATSFFRYSSGVTMLLKANPATVYQSDNKGFFPIHVAASVGAENIQDIILQKFPSSAELRTAQGWTFLHVAIENRRLNIVSFVCRTPSLAWILNMQDNDGNTALHLAVKVSRLRIFCSLFGNKEVHLRLTNNSGQTAHDICGSLIPRSKKYIGSTTMTIHMALTWVGATQSMIRLDQINERYTSAVKQGDNLAEAGISNSTQMLGIGTVLVATVAFGATFALPGGYRADDHVNGGTPTLAGRYTFDAFMMANTLAFICSSIATFGLIFSETSISELRLRIINLGTSKFFMASSLTSLSAAFALAVYVVLAPVAHPTAIVVCVFSPLLVLSRNFEYFRNWAILARPLFVRMGHVRASSMLARMIITRMLEELWPYILIFGWAAIAQKLQNH